MCLYISSFSLLLAPISYQFYYNGTLLTSIRWFIFDHFVHEHYV